MQRDIDEPKPIRVLGADFFEQPALTVARALCGKYLVRSVGGRQLAAQIHETEAYVGPHDMACHASRGRTNRTAVMFGPPGYWYVYLIYGMHWMLNVVTNQESYPAAVLFRGVGQWKGPGKLTLALEIDKRLNGQRAAPSSGLWLEDRGDRVRRGTIRRTPRIGVAYSGHWANKLYRFVLEEQGSARL